MAASKQSYYSSFNSTVKLINMNWTKQKFLKLELDLKRQGQTAKRECLRSRSVDAGNQEVACQSNPRPNSCPGTLASAGERRAKLSEATNVLLCPLCLVFLGGSCNPTTWRVDIAIPMLKKMGITYYNPVGSFLLESSSTTNFSLTTKFSYLSIIFLLSASIAMGTRAD